MQWVQWSVVVGVSLVAAFFDARRRRIPNRLTGPLLLSGLIWAVCVAGTAGLADALVGCMLMALPCVLLFVLAGGGAGDAKLMGAAGVWLGAVNGLAALVAVSVCGMALGLAYAAARRQTRSVVAGTVGMGSRMLLAALNPKDHRLWLTDTRETEPKQTMPYGVAISIGLALAALGALLWHA